jgi:hypothetical protein
MKFRNALRVTPVVLAVLAVVGVLVGPKPLVAQSAPPERAAVLAVADSALAMITKGDMAGFTDLMLPEAVLFPTVTRDGVTRYRVRTRAEQRVPMNVAVAERGWDPQVLVKGPVAMVWYPYDLYLDAKWSHCGVDIFTLVRHEGRWRIATMAWSAEQPPACEKHPEGPPKR